MKNFKMENLKINTKLKTKFAAMTLAGSMALTTLTACGNHDMFDTQYTFNKAIIFGDNTATIVEIKKWADYEGEQYQIQTKEGLVIITSIFDTKLIDDRKSNISAEDFAKSIKGEDVIINYLDDAQITKTK